MTPEEIEIRKNYNIKDEDILQIPAFALWELCRQFDEEMGKSLKGIYSGLCLFEYFKCLTEDDSIQKNEI